MNEGKYTSTIEHEILTVHIRSYEFNSWFSTDPLLCVAGLEEHVEITISPNMHAVSLTVV